MAIAKYSFLVSATLLAATCTSAASAQADDASTARESGQIDDIIVTAQRVGENIQDVPVSITAFSSQAIDRLQINSVADLNRLTPNVKFDPISGGSTGLKPFIRGGGISDGGIITSESEVSFYVDDVYRARVSAALMDFAELERVEVVRGPQGVLYGRNSSAGAVRLVTKSPAEEFKATAQLGYGTWNERRARGYVSIPLSDDRTWRASVNGMIRARDGGRQYNVTLKKKVGEEEFQGVQGDLAYVGDTFEARLSGFYTNTDTDGQWAVPNTVVGTNPKTAIVTLNTGSFRKVASPMESYTHVEQYGSTLRMSTDFPGGQLTSITGYSHLSDSWGQDFSGGVALAPGGPVQALFQRESVASQDQFSQELQAAGEALDGTLEYIAGLYYFTESAEQTVRSAIFFAPSQVRFKIKTNSFAGFGQLTFNLSDQLALIAGGRYTIDDKQLDATLNAVVLSTIKNTYSRFTPKLGFNYKVNPDVLLFASYSQGFKSGGYNGLASSPAQITTPFLPQYTKAYEAGIKADLLGNSVRINLAGFYNEITNRQNTLTLPNGSFAVENYNAELKGLELEATYRISQNLTLWGNAAVNEGKYVSGGHSPGVLGSIIGNDLPVFPKYSYAAGFDASFAIGPGTFRFGSDLGVRDSYFSTADNFAIGFVRKQELLNGYVGYEIGQWSLQVNGKNLLQETGSTSGFGFSVVNPRYAIDPRTLLATVRFTY